MNAATKKILRTTLEADGSISSATITEVLNVLDGRQVSDAEPLPLLLSQADVAKTLRCSRFTVRRLVEDDRLHPVKLRGLTRYSRREIEDIAAVRKDNQA